MRLLALFLGYCLAALFSTSVSMTVTATLWASAWTWGILIFWAVVGHLLIIPAIIAVMFGGAAAGVLGAVGIGWVIEKWNRR
jgi:hypothetical protein